jgi:hypothetical protein
MEKVLKETEPVLAISTSSAVKVIVAALAPNRGFSIAVITAGADAPLRANECETPAPLKFRLEGVGNSLHGHAQ